MTATRHQPLKAAGKRRLNQLKPVLDNLSDRIEEPSYIDSDPIQFMYRYQHRSDRLLAGFFAALMAWGRRDIVINKVDNLLSIMGPSPTDFILNFSDAEAHRFSDFKHRTFKPEDVYWLITLLQHMLWRFGDPEEFWAHCYQLSKKLDRELISIFHEQFLNLNPDVPARLRKHLADSEKNSSCKRLYLYLRWTVRQNSLVDTGLMNFMPASELMIPLDVHVARHGRRLGLLTRKQNDWKAVCELTEVLKKLNPDDPARYDYALFGVGVMQHSLPKNLIVNKDI